MRGLSLVAARGGHSSSRCAGLSLSRPLLLRSTRSRRAGSVVVAHGPSCSAACGIFPDQGSNPCPLHWQADSQPRCHQGSPIANIFEYLTNCQTLYTPIFVNPSRIRVRVGTIDIHILQTEESMKYVAQGHEPQSKPKHADSSPADTLCCFSFVSHLHVLGGSLPYC